MFRKDKFIEKEVIYQGLYYTKWLDHDGTEIDPNKYILSQIAGNSLEPAKIKDGDVCFIDKKTLYEYSNIELPKCCVFYRAGKYDDELNNHAKFICGEVFARANQYIDDLDKIIDDILNSEKFQRYKTDIRYVSDEYIKSNFNPIRRYNNISIFPHINHENKWVLEWQDSREILGTIEYAFTINKKGED